MESPINTMLSFVFGGNENEHNSIISNKLIVNFFFLIIILLVSNWLSKDIFFEHTILPVLRKKNGFRMKEL